MTIETLPAPHDEIERKFTVIIDALPEDILETAEKHIITQIYTAINGDGSETRVRRDHDVTTGEISCTQTSKSSGGVGRIEIEKPIEEGEYIEEARKGVEGSSPIEKVRYKIPYQYSGKEYTIELDIYKGNLSGMVVAEVEFDTQEEADQFVGPSWLGEDVSEDKPYKNKNLAMNGIPGGYVTDVALSGMKIITEEVRLTVPKKRDDQSL